MTSEIIHKRSKATLLADEVRTNILAGKLQEGDKLLPDNQLAAHYGISKQTVAAGLNDLVAEGLLERAPGRGTIVISNTGNLDATSNAVGMITMGTGHVYGRLCRHMSKLLIQRGCFPVLINQDLFREASGIRDMLEAMNSERLKPRGFIIEGRYPFPFEYLAEHLAEFPNLVFCNVYHHPVRLPGIKYVLVDYREAGRQVATHFLQRGHRQIIHLAVHENYYRGIWASIQAMCHEGFTELMAEAGQDTDHVTFWRLMQGEPLPEVLDEIFARPKAPTALFLYADANIQYHLLPYLQTRGLLGKVEIAGIYNTPYARESGFASVSIKEDKIAESAVELLLDHAEAHEVTIQPELIVHAASR